MEASLVDNLESIDLTGQKYSQYGEDIIADYIFNHLGTTNKFFVDIGAGGAGRQLSNTHFFKLRGWEGLAFDMDGSEGTINEFIKPNNIVSLLTKYECPKEFDFLSVDIDSFDYDVIGNILSAYSPRLVVAEFNGTLDPLSKVKLEYEDGYTWDTTNKYGFSLGAGIDLFEKHGYTVVLNHKETNIFAIRKDLLPEGYKKEIKGVRTMYHRHNPNAKWVAM